MENFTRFKSPSKKAISVLEEVREKWFGHLDKANIKVLFDTKLRMKGNAVVLGRILRANDLIKKLTEDFYPAGCDYIIFLDNVAFENMNIKDRTRLVRHELRHCLYVPESKKPWRLVPHDIEDFEVEIKLNSDDVGWAKRVATLTSTIYEQQKEMEKELNFVPKKVKRIKR